MPEDDVRVLGLDEAGRGCVLGPLVVGAYLWEGSTDDALVDAGAGDSKKMSAKKRVRVREALSPLGTWTVREISANTIDRGNLNALEEDAIVALIREHTPDRVIIDALGHPRTMPATIERLRRRLGEDAPEILMEPKADANHPVVGAASVFAKTHRDEVCEGLKGAHGDFGSGYPSDPKTRRWILHHFEEQTPLPFFVRTRWGTIETLRQQALFST